MGYKGYKWHERKQAERKKRQQETGEEMETNSDSEEMESDGEPGVIFTVDPETGQQVRLGRAVDAEAAGASGSIAAADPPIPKSEVTKEKTKSEKMEIPVEDVLRWNIEEGEIVEPMGPSERLVHISEPAKPGTQSQPVLKKGRGRGRGLRALK